MIVMIKNIVD